MMKQKPMNVRIKPTANASQRTKNRIAERGPWFAVEKKNDLAKSFGGALARIGKTDSESWLLKEIGGPDGDPWIGWLPANEFEVVETEGFWTAA